jgi:hypothetical protein
VTCTFTEEDAAPRPSGCEVEPVAAEDAIRELLAFSVYEGFATISDWAKETNVRIPKYGESPNDAIVRQYVSAVEEGQLESQIEEWWGEREHAPSFAEVASVFKREVAEMGYPRNLEDHVADVAFRVIEHPFETMSLLPAESRIVEPTAMYAAVSGMADAQFMRLTREAFASVVTSMESGFEDGIYDTSIADDMDYMLVALGDSFPLLCLFKSMVCKYIKSLDERLQAIAAL